MKNPNEKYFNELINDHHRLIMKVCMMFHPDKAGREDLYQMICLNIWRGLSGFKGNAKLSTWLYRVALNTALAEVSKLKKEPLHQAEMVEELKEDQPHDIQDQIAALYAGIDRLNAVEKAIILLYLEENSYEEIAEITGISKTYVSVKLVRIKKKLESLINDYKIKRGQK